MNCSKKTFFITAFFFASSIAFSQNLFPQKSYRTKIHLLTKTIEKGYLNRVSDSTLVLAISSHKIPIMIFDTIPFSKIRKISFTKKGSGHIGFLVGALTSISIGVYSHITESDPQSKAAGFDIMEGIIFAPVLGGVGALIGSNSGKVFKINGEYSNFKSMKEYLHKRSYVN